MNNMMTDLIEFIRARLDEREQAARDAEFSSGGAEWVYQDIHLEGRTRLGRLQLADEAPIEYWGTYEPDDAPIDGHQMAHIALHDPARVLREVEAARGIVAALELDEVRLAAAADQSGTAEAHVILGRVFALRDVVRVLGAVDADHPDYMSEWAPELS